MKSARIGVQLETFPPCEIRFHNFPLNMMDVVRSSLFWDVNAVYIRTYRRFGANLSQPTPTIPWIIVPYYYVICATAIQALDHV